MINEYAFYLEHEPVFIEESYLAPPLLTYDPRRKMWRLENDYNYEELNFSIIVFAGFEFDLASIPRAVWWAIAPFELSIVAPLIHDILYNYGGRLPNHLVHPYRTFTRLEADQLFLKIMRKEGIAESKCRIAYNAVRAAGWKGWNGNIIPVEENAILYMPV